MPKFSQILSLARSRSQFHVTRVDTSRASGRTGSGEVSVSSVVWRRTTHSGQSLRQPRLDPLARLTSHADAPLNKGATGGNAYQATAGGRDGPLRLLLPICQQPAVLYASCRFSLTAQAQSQRG